jgi:putative phosphoribosyl transferase
MYEEFGATVTGKMVTCDYFSRMRASIRVNATMHAAVSALRGQKPARIVVAVPVASIEARDELRREADEVVCVKMPDPFWALGPWYVDFHQVTDEEVRTLLERAAERCFK